MTEQTFNLVRIGSGQVTTLSIGDRVVAPWAKFGDYQEGNVTRLYTRKGVQLADVVWDPASNPDVYAGDSEGIVASELVLASGA